MGKRIGVNNRRKALKRRPVRHAGAGRFLAAVVAGAVLIAAGAYAGKTYGGKVSALAAKLQGSGNTAVEKVVVQGSMHINIDDMIKRGALSMPKNLKEFKPERLQALFRANPWIEKIDNIRAAGTTVTLAVSERRPVALLQKGSICLVDHEGVCLPLAARTAYELPLLSGLADSTGKDGIRRLTAEDCGRMNRFLRGARLADSSFAAAVTQACFGPDRAVSVVLSAGPTVVVFDESDMGAGLQRLARVWEGVQAEENPPARIDLSYRNLAFVTLQTAPGLAAAAEAKKNKG
jgi:cell division septal protein FtsQ